VRLFDFFFSVLKPFIDFQLTRKVELVLLLNFLISIFKKSGSVDSHTSLVLNAFGYGSQSLRSVVLFISSNLRHYTLNLEKEKLVSNPIIE